MTARYDDSKVILMTSICLRILGGETFTARKIQEEYGVGIRTAHRHILAMERLIPMIVDGGSGSKPMKVRVLR